MSLWLCLHCMFWLAQVLLLGCLKAFAGCFVQFPAELSPYIDRSCSFSARACPMLHSGAKWSGLLFLLFLPCLLQVLIYTPKARIHPTYLWQRSMFMISLFWDPGKSLAQRGTLLRSRDTWVQEGCDQCLTVDC